MEKDEALLWGSLGYNTIITQNVQASSHGSTNPWVFEAFISCKCSVEQFGMLAHIRQVCKGISLIEFYTTRDCIPSQNAQVFQSTLAPAVES